MDRSEMMYVKGGLCLHSCPRGSRLGKKCCGDDVVMMTLTFSCTQE